jgi:ectoine hydroxylase-related dioxygenase (phytanoyl-CoA dioxygenase family)
MPRTPAIDFASQRYGDFHEANTILTLDAHYALGCDQIAFFRANGFIKLKNVLSPQAIAYFGREITRLTLELNTQTKPLEERSTYDKAFLQVMNLWEHSSIVREFVLGKRLGRIAAELLEVSGVRLYHDQALYKEAHGGITPAHADQYYWPLSSDRTVTAWIPLQAVPMEMGPLAFYARSHTAQFGRDLGISDESEAQITANMQAQGFPLVDEPFDLGEVSFHNGWTFHRAGANTTDRPRAVMTVIYMDHLMRLKEPSNDNQRLDRASWCPGAVIGDVIQTPKNLPIYSASA